MLRASRIPPGPHCILLQAPSQLTPPIQPQLVLRGSERWAIPALQILEANPWALHLLPPRRHLKTTWRALGTAFLGDFRGETKNLWAQSQFLLAVGKQLVFSSSLIPPLEEQCHRDRTGMAPGWRCPAPAPGSTDGSLNPAHIPAPSIPHSPSRLAWLVSQGNTAHRRALETFALPRAIICARVVTMPPNPPKSPPAPLPPSSHPLAKISSFLIFSGSVELGRDLNTGKTPRLRLVPTETSIGIPVPRGGACPGGI